MNFKAGDWVRLGRDIGDPDGLGLPKAGSYLRLTKTDHDRDDGYFNFKGKLIYIHLNDKIHLVTDEAEKALAALGS